MTLRAGFGDKHLLFQARAENVAARKISDFYIRFTLELMNTSLEDEVVRLLVEKFLAEKRARNLSRKKSKTYNVSSNRRPRP